ncbi:MAG: ATP-dependent 6-phosphofructokinase [Persephonella sp.]|nr:MAG: ATP-dependent 6-phosphofructokinase [Persephonella sp.]RUM60871.1 MAG: ATP-dependent 6-phosphofructokinase [Persephonella sp.]
MKKIALLTSGGDAPGLNACIRAVVRTGYYYGLEVFGVRRGYKGLIENDFFLLKTRDVSGILEKGGTILLTSREERFSDFKYRKIAYKNLKNKGIDGIFIIGGNGSLEGAYLLAEEFNIPVIFIPKTIDNDIYGTDYTIGFDTAVNTVVDAISKIRDTSYSHERIFIVEVMGRKSGFIALASGIAGGADITLIPEYPFPMYLIEESIEKAFLKGKKNFIIVLAEGVSHAKEFRNLLIDRLNRKKVNISDIKYSVLGYIQRGGSPSAFDRILATRFGVFAVKEYLAGQKNIMVALEENKLKTKKLKDVHGKIKTPNIEDFETSKIVNFI